MHSAHRSLSKFKSRAKSQGKCDGMQCRRGGRRWQTGWVEFYVKKWKWDVSHFAFSPCSFWLPTVCIVLLCMCAKERKMEKKALCDTHIFTTYVVVYNNHPVLWPWLDEGSPPPHPHVFPAPSHMCQMVLSHCWIHFHPPWLKASFRLNIFYGIC